VIPGKKSGVGRHLILFYNSLWGWPEDIPSSSGLPPDVDVTTDLRRFSEARAVVFHIPSLGGIERLRKPEGQIWVAWWKESERQFPRLDDQSFMSRFDLTMSHRRDADVFTSLEREVLGYAEAMTETEPTVTDEMVASLRGQLGDSALVELTAVIAFANFTTRPNVALGIESDGFAASCGLRPLAGRAVVGS